VALAHFPQTAGFASNESVRHHDLRRAPGDHLILDSNAVHGGLDQRFPDKSSGEQLRLLQANTLLILAGKYWLSL